MWGYKHRDPAIRSRARDQAAWLVRDHGDDAEAVLRAKMTRRGVSRDDSYRFRLTLEELEKIRANGGTGRRRRRRKKKSLFQRLLARLSFGGKSGRDD